MSKSKKDISINFNIVSKGNGSLENRSITYNPRKKNFKYDNINKEYEATLNVMKCSVQIKKIINIFDNESKKICTSNNLIEDIDVINRIFDDLEMIGLKLCFNKNHYMLYAYVNTEFFANSSKNHDNHNREFIRNIIKDSSKTGVQNFFMYPQNGKSHNFKSHNHKGCDECLSVAELYYGEGVPSNHPSDSNYPNIAECNHAIFLRARINDMILKHSTFIKLITKCLRILLKAFLDKTISDDKYIYKTFFKSIDKIFNPSVNNNKKIYNVMISLDSEWFNTDIDNNIELREYKDFLSQQFVVRVKEYPNYCGKFCFYFNGVSNIPGSLEESLNVLLNNVEQDLLTGKYGFHDHFINADLINVVIFGYYGGVDISSFKHWERDFKDMIVLNKHMPFTTASIIKNLHGKEKNKSCQLHINYLDIGNLTSGNLADIGENINLPKIDTEKYDLLDGFEKGYYKKHMDVFRRNHPNEYYDYSIRDSEIVDAFVNNYCQTNNLDPFKNIPKTTSSKVSNLIYKNLQTNKLSNLYEYPYQRDTSFSIIKNNPSRYVVNGYSDIYNIACRSFSGGYNKAFVSGYSITDKEVYSLDLSSAYSVAGTLMPIISFNENAIVECNPEFYNPKNINIYKDYNFEKLYNELYFIYNSKLPFLCGFGCFNIDYNELDGIVTTPTRYDNSPVYVKHCKNVELSWTDALNAYIQGADITIHNLSFPPQTFERLNSWAEIQIAFINQRIAFSKSGNSFAAKDCKLSANSVFGVSAQGINNINKRNFATNDMEKLPISKSSNPLVACLYTSYTRYLITLLRNTTHELYGDGITDLHITTDGYSFMVNDDFNISNEDIEAISTLMLKKLGTYYKERLEIIGYKKPFKVEGHSRSRFFNLRTRFYGCCDSEPAMDALAGLKNYSLEEVYTAISNNEFILKEKTANIMNLTDMKHMKKNKNRGLLFNENLWKNSSLSYDMGLKPYKYICNENLHLYLCKPFEDLDEYVRYRKLMKIMKKSNFYIKEDIFKDFLFDLNHLSTNNIEKSLKTFEDNPNYIIELSQNLYDIINDNISLSKKQNNYSTLYRNRKAFKNGNPLTIPLSFRHFTKNL